MKNLLIDLIIDKALNHGQIEKDLINNIIKNGI